MSSLFRHTPTLEEVRATKVRRQLERDAERAKESLTEFVKIFWPLVDPGMPLRMNWHVEAICDHLEAVSRGDIRKLLINIPPGHAKSLLVSVFWPAWEWTWAPSKQSIFSSYAAELAERDSVRCRDLMMQEKYQHAFVIGKGYDGRPLWTFNPSENRVNSFKNTLAGSRQCLSVGSKATGFRGNKVVCDDPLNVKEAHSKTARDEAIYWWSQVMPTRINDPATDAFVIIMQRVHEEDLSGYVLGGGGYEHLCLPTEFEGDRRSVTYVRRVSVEPDVADTKIEFFRDPRTQEGELLFPALFTPRVVAELKKPVTGLGADGFAGQHQQSPTSAEGGMFKRAWWRFWRPDGVAAISNFPRPRGCVGADTHPAKVLPKVHQIVGSLDAAFKDGHRSDYVVFTVWGVYFAERYLLEVVRGKMDFEQTKKTLAGCGKPSCRGCALCALSLVKRYPRCKRWLVEDKANGAAIVNSLKMVVPGIIELNPQGGKEARASAMQPACEAAQVYLLEGAAWVEEYVEEFSVFPRGKHDDQVDSSSQAMIYLGTNIDVARAYALGTSL